MKKPAADFPARALLRCCQYAGDLPGVSNAFAGSLEASLPAVPFYFAWGCFRYFYGVAPDGAKRGPGSRRGEKIFRRKIKVVGSVRRRPRRKP
jgi:hypothetical protein